LNSINVLSVSNADGGKITAKDTAQYEHHTKQ